MILKSCLYFILIVSYVHLTNAQEVTGNLEGSILDTQGKHVPGVAVTVTSPSLQGQRTISSDDNGYFRFLSLPCGLYTIKLSHVSFQSKTINDVRVRLGKTTTIGEEVLWESAVAMPEVVITCDRPLVDPTSTTNGVNLLRDKFEDLPLERNYRYLAAIAPEANQSYYGDEVNISGSSGLENRYFINGNEVTDADAGRGGMNLPYNFIREVELKTGGYEPEYKSALGGIVNVVTYSGGNKFSGQAFGFFTNNKLSGEPRITESKPSEGDLLQYDFGLTLGGPIIKDRLWFFSAYAPSFRNEDVKLPGLGYYSDKTENHAFSGKLTWKATDELDVSATVIGDPTVRNDIGSSISRWAVLKLENPDPALSQITTGGYGFFLDARHVASSDLMLQGAFSLTTRGEKWHPASGINTSEMTYFDASTGTISGGYSYTQEWASTIPEVKISATAIINKHMLKAGIAYKEVHENLNWEGSYLSRFSDDNFQIENFFGDGTLKHRFPSVYLQDSWDISKSLRMTGGLRWDGAFIIGSNGQLVSRILKQYQPRLGVVFMPGGDESSKISASAGRYAEDLLMYGTTLFYLSGTRFSRTQYDHDPRIDPSGSDTLVSFEGYIPTGVRNLIGQYYDEISLAYERLLSDDFKITIRGTMRLLREIIEDSEYPVGSWEFYLGNPGHAPLTMYPHPKREYSSLQITLEKTWGNRFNLLGSYVLSRNYGNYPGFFNQDGQGAAPNTSRNWDFIDLFNNATGLLPNDRTHVFKVNASYRFGFGLTCGTTFSWMSGTPLSEYGRNSIGYLVHLVQRGTVGRLPALWDLNLRFTYGPPIALLGEVRPRVILDVFHVASQREVVRQGEAHYLEVDDEGNYFNPDPSYGMPLSFKPPMSVRLGIEVNF